MNANLEQLEELFVGMKIDGFDTDSPLRWGFYFIDNSKDRLSAVFDELKDHGYELVRLSETEDSNWMLVATKIDTLTAERLHKRNLAFNDLAVHCNVESYDGWDVEKL